MLVDPNVQLDLRSRDHLDFLVGSIAVDLHAASSDQVSSILRILFEHALEILFTDIGIGMDRIDLVTTLAVGPSPHGEIEKRLIELAAFLATQCSHDVLALQFVCIDHALETSHVPGYDVDVAIFHDTDIPEFSSERISAVRI